MSADIVMNQWSIILFIFASFASVLLIIYDLKNEQVKIERMRNANNLRQYENKESKTTSTKNQVLQLHKKNTLE